MASLIFANVSSTMVSSNWMHIPSFDWNAALLVGAIVAVATVVVIAVAIATPVVAVQGGATLLGTCLAIGGIALVTGICGGCAAGFYRGHQGDIKREEQLDNIKRVSNQLDIHFEPSADPKRAKDFVCFLVSYEETDLRSGVPTVTTKKVKIIASDSNGFYSQVQSQMKRWFNIKVSGDLDGQKRRVKIYMNPFPGEGIYERLMLLATMNEVRSCIVERSESAWVSALPE